MKKLIAATSVALFGGVILVSQLGATYAPATSSQHLEPTLAHVNLDPCVNGMVSHSGLFPTQAMEDQFHAYVAWTQRNGLSLEHAFNTITDVVTSLEPGMNGLVSASGRFPTQAMEDQFLAYKAWTQATGVGSTHLEQAMNAVQTATERQLANVDAANSDA